MTPVELLLLGVVIGAGLSLIAAIIGRWIGGRVA